MKRYILIPLLLTIFNLTSCTEETGPAPAPPEDMEHKFSYLALGDSYTIGEGISAAGRWGEQLAEMLRKNNFDISDPAIIARTGWITSELASAIRGEDPPADFDLVSLLIGVNNQYRGQSLATYRTEFRELLQTSIRLAGKDPDNVIVLSIPDWGATPFATGRDRAQIAQEIDAFNAVAKEEALEAGVAYIDITPLTRQFGNDAEYLANDRLHYSARMYEKWAMLALPVAKEILEEE